MNNVKIYLSSDTLLEESPWECENRWDKGVAGCGKQRDTASWYKARHTLCLPTTARDDLCMLLLTPSPHSNVGSCIRRPSQGHWSSMLLPLFPSCSDLYGVILLFLPFGRTKKVCVDFSRFLFSTAKLIQVQKPGATPKGQGLCLSHGLQPSICHNFLNPVPVTCSLFTVRVC